MFTKYVELKVTVMYGLIEGQQTHQQTELIVRTDMPPHILY
jgi:hypothetical protein